MAARTKKTRRPRRPAPDAAERLLALATVWSSPIPWEIVANRESKWQSARDYTDNLRRIASKARDSGEAENKGLLQQIADAEHQEDVWEKHRRAMSTEIAELETLITRLRPDLKGDYGPAVASAGQLHPARACGARLQRACEADDDQFRQAHRYRPARP